MKLEARFAVLASFCVALAACEQTTVPTAPDAESVSKAAAAADAPEAIAKIESAGKTITAFDEPTLVDEAALVEPGVSSPAFTFGAGSQPEILGPDGQLLLEMMDEANAQLAAAGANIRVSHAEWISVEAGQAVGQTIFASDRGNKQIGLKWVPGDPRRFGPGDGSDITYVVDESFGNSGGGGLSPAETTGAIDRAMTTWDTGTQCSNTPMTKVADPGNFFSALFGNLPVADIQHIGWGFLLGPNTLGVTFPFLFVSGGVPTDIDGDGNFDYAVADIFYNPIFGWAIDGNIDVETVAFHEAGHGLGQAHFGKIFRTDSNGKLHFAPRASMNAAYSGVQQGPSGTDTAGHCSLFGSWPN